MPIPGDDAELPETRCLQVFGGVCRCGHRGLCFDAQGSCGVERSVATCCLFCTPQHREAAGRTSVADAARHYAIARGSAMESAAILDVVRCLSALRPEQDHRGMELLARMVAMLTKLCR